MVNIHPRDKLVPCPYAIEQAPWAHQLGKQTAPAGVRAAVRWAYDSRESWACLIEMGITRGTFSGSLSHKLFFSLKDLPPGAPLPERLRILRDDEGAMSR